MNHPSPGAHGGDSIAVARALGVEPTDLLDLSQSLNPFADDISTLLPRHLGAAHRYPDPTEAHEALSEEMGVEPERLLLTNGGSEAIALVASTIGGRPLFEPEFGLHPRAADGPLWRSDPHNPSGDLSGDDDRVGVWDEAFYPLATGRWTSGRATTIVGSLTKVFACPGLRLGYVIDDEIGRYLSRRPHWAVNSLALAVLPELLAGADLPRWRSEIAHARTTVGHLFESAGYEVRSNDAPWVLVKAPGMRDLLLPLGIVVRDCSSFGMSEWVRVGIPDPAGQQRLADALGHLA